MCWILFKYRHEMLEYGVFLIHERLLMPACQS